MGAKAALSSEEASLLLLCAAPRQAAMSIAERAELLACEMEEGSIADLGGPEALRLLAAVIRILSENALVPAGGRN
jgi:hypothetical protein